MELVKQNDWRETSRNLQKKKTLTPKNIINPIEGIRIKQPRECQNNYTRFTRIDFFYCCFCAFCAIAKSEEIKNHWTVEWVPTTQQEWFPNGQSDLNFALIMFHCSAKIQLQICHCIALTQKAIIKHQNMHGAAGLRKKDIISHWHACKLHSACSVNSDGYLVFKGIFL